MTLRKYFIFGGFISVLTLGAACSDDPTTQPVTENDDDLGGSGGNKDGGGGNGGNSEPEKTTLNGCHLEDTAVKDAGDQTITFVSTSYTPSCLKVKKDTKVIFSGDFETHPLLKKASADAEAKTNTTSENFPLSTEGKDINTSSLNEDADHSDSFTFTATGNYGYVCTNHEASNMYGAIFVVE